MSKWSIVKEYEEDIYNILLLKINWKVLYGKSFLITGATGLIGTVFVDTLMLLNSKYLANIKIYACSRDKERAYDVFKDYWNETCFSFIEHDIVIPLELQYPVDYIIHAASNTHPKAYSADPIGTIMTNTQGLVNLFELSKKQHNCNVLFLSSVEIYGENRGDVDSFDELYNGYLNCNTFRANYPESKRLCESICQCYRELYGQSVYIARLCRIYGPSILKTDSKASSQFIKNALNNEDIILKSNGEQYYSYLYVVDAVSALFTILINGKEGEAYNISDKASDVKLKDLALIISSIVSTKVIFDIPNELERKGFSVVLNAVLDSFKLRKLGWSACYDICEGMRRTIKIMQKNEAHI